MIIHYYDTEMIFIIHQS